MRKKIIIIGIMLFFVCIGLSGCDAPFREGIPVLPDYRISALSIEDNCETVYPQLGTAYVNFTITNHGAAGSEPVIVRLYQGIEDKQSCGNGQIYNVTRVSEVRLQNEESKQISMVFPGIYCSNGTNCYGYNISVGSLYYHH